MQSTRKILQFSFQEQKHSELSNGQIKMTKVVFSSLKCFTSNHFLFFEKFYQFYIQNIFYTTVLCIVSLLIQNYFVLAMLSLPPFIILSVFSSPFTPLNLYFLSVYLSVKLTRRIFKSFPIVITHQLHNAPNTSLFHSFILFLVSVTGLQPCWDTLLFMDFY